MTNPTPDTQTRERRNHNGRERLRRTEALAYLTDTPATTGGTTARNEPNTAPLDANGTQSDTVHHHGKVRPE